MRIRALAAAVTVTLAIAAGTAGAQDIDTQGTQNERIVSNRGSLGQSFTVPMGSSLTLDGYAFWVGLTTSGESYSFQTFIYALGAGGPTGPALFTSDVRSAGGARNIVVREDYATGGLALTPGTMYIAMIHRTTPGQLHSGLADGPVGGWDDTYAGGAAYAATGSWATDPTQATYTTDIFSPGTDLVFVADFTVATTAPEPATVLLVGGGLLALGAVRRRRRA